MKISLDTDQVKDLSQKADQIVFSPEAEDTLLKLLDLQEQLEVAIKDAKTKIEKSALEMDKNFMSVQGDKVKVSYRAFGSRYSLDESHLKDLPENLYTKSVKYYPNSKEIDKLANETGMLPQGILEPQRLKQIVIQRKK